MSTGLWARRALPGALFVYLVMLSTATPAEDSAAGEAVIVTASRVAEAVDDSLWSSTVLTREDIQSRQVSQVQDLLANLAGVNIDNSGGLGKASSVFLRGANSDHTLVLIDGVRVGSATLGTAPFELIPVEQIDRIEVVRGPRSTLYGSDAIGGVIQIFTHRESQPGVTFGGSVMNGSHDTHEFTADLQARSARAWVSLTGDTLTTRGINSCLPGAATAGAACFLDAPNLNPDGFHNHSGALSAGWRLNDRLTAQADELITSGWTAYDGSFSNNTQFTERVTSLHLDANVTQSWHARLLAGRDVDVQKNFLDRAFVSRFDTTRDSASVQIDGNATSAVRVISGVDYERDHIDTDANDPYAVTSRGTKGVFAEIHGDLAAWSGLAGARLENNDQFGHHVTENLGLVRKLGRQARLSLTWGTAFHAPTFNDLYFPGFGNPRLVPEVSRSFEAGVDAAAAALHWSLHVYQTTIDRLIAFDATTFLPQNIDQARIRGAELQADWRSSAWKIGAQLTRMDPLNRSEDANRGHLLPRRAKESASLEVRRFLTAAPLSAPGSIAAVARWESRRFDDLANRLAMGGYLTVDVMTEWTVARDWKLQATAANVFNRDYQTAAYFAQDRRHYGVTVRYQVTAK